jgi:hypothetical protein
MKWFLLFAAIHASLQALIANEASVQWRYEPLKILHQVGKGTMTKAGIYRFPVPMYYTHPQLLLNSIAGITTLAEFTNVEDKDALPNVNLANLYGIKVSYDMAEDVREIDLTNVVRPKGEEFSVNEVIRMTFECIRLNGSLRYITIKTNEKTKKWKAAEPMFRAGLLREPLFRPKVVALETNDSDLVYHWAYLAGNLADEQMEPTRFPTYGGAPHRFGGANTSYRGIGSSLELFIYPEDENGILAEVNQHVGYEFLLKNGVLTISAPTAADRKGPKFHRYPNSLDRMNAAVECLRRSAQVNGDEFTLKIVDPSLTLEERSAIESQWPDLRP